MSYNPIIVPSVPKVSYNTIILPKEPSVPKQTLLVHCVEAFGNYEQVSPNERYETLCGQPLPVVMVSHVEVFLGLGPPAFLRDLEAPSEYSRRIYDTYEIVKCPHCLEHEDLPFLLLRYEG